MSLKLTPIDQTPYGKEAAKLADLENRAAAFEQEEREALEADAAELAAQSIPLGDTVEALTAPVATVPTVKHRDIAEIRKDLARWNKAIELQKPITAKAKAEAMKAAIAIANTSLAPIIERAAAKLKEAAAIATEANGVVEALAAGGYKQAWIDDGSGDELYRESRLLSANFEGVVAAVAKLPVDWIGIVEELQQKPAAGMYLKFISSIAGHDRAMSPGDLALWTNMSEARRLIEHGLAVEVPFAEAITLQRMQGKVIKKQLGPAVTEAEKPKPGIVGSVAAFLKSANPFAPALVEGD